MKLKREYWTFLVLYLIALFVAGANRLINTDTALSRAWLLIWDLMPSQTFGWWAISFGILMILIILVFVAGCKLIAYSMRKRRTSGGSEIKNEYRNAIISGVLGAIGGTIMWYILRGEVPWVYLFTYPIFSFIIHLYANKRREAKKEVAVQRRE